MRDPWAALRIRQLPGGPATPGRRRRWDLTPNSLPVLQEGDPHESGLVAHACACLLVHGSRKAGETS